MGHAKIKTKKKRKSPEAFKVLLGFLLENYENLNSRQILFDFEEKMKRYLRGFLVEN